MKKHVRFIPGNVSNIREYDIPWRRMGYQKTGDKFQTRSSGRVPQEKLNALQRAAKNEIISRVEKRGRFTVHYNST